MTESHTTDLRRALADSALILAGATGLLFFWGTIIRMSKLFALGVPLDVVREITIQDYLFKGWLFIFVLLPFVVLADSAVDGRASAWILRVGATTPRRLVVSFVVLLFLTFVAADAIGRWSAGGVRYRVARLTPKSGSMLVAHKTMKILYFVSRTDQDTILVDRWAKPDASVLVIANDELSELVLVAER